MKTTAACIAFKRKMPDLNVKLDVLVFNISSTRCSRCPAVHTTLAKCNANTLISIVFTTLKERKKKTQSTTHKHISAYLTSPFNFYCCLCCIIIAKGIVHITNHTFVWVNELIDIVTINNYISMFFHYYLTISFIYLLPDNVSVCISCYKSTLLQ